MSKAKKNKQVWYEVLRSDGTKQYASRWEGKGDYFLGGSGFGYSKFDAVSVKEIDEVPHNIVKGKAHIEGMHNFQAIRDLNRSWNGWALPSIHESEVDRFIETMQWDEFKVTKKGKNLLINDTSSGDHEFSKYTIKPMIWEGETYYWMGDFGWVWEFTVESKK